MKTLLRLVLLGSILGGAGHAFATGYYGPKEYLAGGGKNLVATPEFYWDLETKRLAKDFHPAEKPMVAPRDYTNETAVDQAGLLKATADADTGDFADALKTGAIKPPDPAKATQQNDAARQAVVAPASGTALPDEFDSEFADYHRGAYAYRQGPTHWDEAKKAWLALLNRPAAERHYRTLWATFMLGKLAMKSGDPDAIKWFEKTRELAKQGFADSLGMAADSYGWEGRSEWKQGHPEKAAPLFLTQLALGDESAVISLKALIPDRTPIDGMLNYGPEPDDSQRPADATLATVAPATLAGLKAAAQDPLLRRLVTAHILATGWGDRSPGFGWSSTNTRSAEWLKMIAELKPGTMEDAEYLGWLAYMDGDYPGAQRWLDLSQSNSAAADWLRAKLELRAGHLDDAVKSLAQAIDILRSPALYTGWAHGAYPDTSQSGSPYTSDTDEESWSMPAAASGDLGGMHLERGDFVQAMDIMLKGNLWEDAAFIAERVLTADELKTYVDKISPPPADTNPARDTDDSGANGSADERASASEPGFPQNLRYLLGRRLVREDRYAEAIPYFPFPYDKILQKYSDALKDGANESLPKLKRAQAWFTAAWLAKYDGMELMGTEVAPDGFVSDGDFENTDLAQERLSGTHTEEDFSSEQVKTSTPKNPISTSLSERQRLKKNKIEPDSRYHYRYIAAALAMRAAALMDDNTEELADVVNTAGQWVMNLDDKAGDRYYSVIERRCPKTKLGASVVAKHWFADQPGPWSTAQQTAFDAMTKEYGDPNTKAQ